MKKNYYKYTLLALMCVILLYHCSDDPTSPENKEPTITAKLMEGKIISIRDEILTWSGLRFGLINLSYLEVLGEIKYNPGEAFCCSEIGTDSSFSFDLPAEIDERWIAMSGNSPAFYTIVYNDTNSNNQFDYEPDPEPYEILYIDSQILGCVLYVTDPSIYSSLNIEVSLGWNYLVSSASGSSDFNRLFIMGTYSY